MEGVDDRYPEGGITAGEFENQNAKLIVEIPEWNRFKIEAPWIRNVVHAGREHVA